MATFAPQIQDESVPKLFNEVASAPHMVSPIAATLTGIGSALKDAATGAVNYAQDRIDYLAQTGYDAISDMSNAEAQSVLNPKGVREAAANGVPIQDAQKELTEGLSRAEALTQAKGLGKLNNANYYAQVDLLARNLRAQFPGFRDHIDKQMAELLGRTPANELHRALSSELAALGDKTGSDRQQKLEDHAVQHIGFLPDNYVQARDSNDPNAFRILQNFVMADSQRKTDFHLADEGYKIKKERNEDTQESALNAATKASSLFQNQFIDRTSNTEIGKQFWSMIDQAKGLNDEAASRVLDNVDTNEIARQFRMNKDAYMRGVASSIQQYSADMNPQKKSELMKSAEEYYNNLTTAIQDKDVGFLSYQKKTKESYDDYSVSHVLSFSENMRIQNGLKTVWGGQAFAAWQQNAERQSTNEREINLMSHGRLLDGTYSSAEQAFRDYKKAGALNMSNATGTLDTISKAITDPSTKPEARNAYWESMFNLRNNEMLTSIKPVESQVQLITKFLNPEFQGQVAQLHKDGTITEKQFGNYVNWASQSSAAIIHNPIANLNQTYMGSNFVSVTYDPTQMKFSVGDKTPAPANNPIGGAAKIIDRLGSTGEVDRMRAEADKANAVISVVAGMAKSTGADPKAYVEKWLRDKAGSVVGAEVSPPAGGLENISIGQRNLKDDISALASRISDHITVPESNMGGPGLSGILDSLHKWLEGKDSQGNQK